MDDQLVHDEAWHACDGLPQDVSLDFIYLDPPYGVGTRMTARTAPGEHRGRGGKQSGPVAYADTEPVGDLVAMIVRAAKSIQARMNPSASFAVHLDHRAVHETKVALDGIFGSTAFLGEIIWIPGNGARGRSLSMTHQTILLFARSNADRKRARWNVEHPLLRESFAKTSLAMHFIKVDEQGRRFRERVIAGKSYRYFADEGRKLGSVWADIPAMRANTPLNKEGTGYPTQKPEPLLERLIVATTEPGDVVADFMCGSGTTLAVAARLGRRFVGGDREALAIETTSRRLTSQGARFTLVSARL